MIAKLGDLNQSKSFKSITGAEGIEYVIVLDSDGPGLKFVTISNDGFIRMIELDATNDKAVT